MISRRQIVITSSVLVMLVSFMAPVAATPVADRATPAAFDCNALASYWTDVYHPAEPDATMSETAIARAAWDGWPAFEQMTRTELHTAQLFYDQWARNLAEIPADGVPGGLQEFHNLNIREIDARSRAVLAYLDYDLDAYDSVTDEMWKIMEERYALAMSGIEQCGDQWVDAMGEPWDPSPDATPVATPSA